jgi:hypothetical protein
MQVSIRLLPLNGGYFAGRMPKKNFLRGVRKRREAGVGVSNSRFGIWAYGRGAFIKLAAEGLSFLGKNV